MAIPPWQVLQSFFAWHVAQSWPFFIDCGPCVFVHPVGWGEAPLRRLSWHSRQLSCVSFSLPWLALSGALPWWHVAHGKLAFSVWRAWLKSEPKILSVPCGGLEWHLAHSEAG